MSSSGLSDLLLLILALPAGLEGLAAGLILVLGFDAGVETCVTAWKTWNLGPGFSSASSSSSSSSSPSSSPGRLKLSSG